MAMRTIIATAITSDEVRHGTAPPGIEDRRISCAHSMTFSLATAMSPAEWTAPLLAALSKWGYAGPRSRSACWWE